MAFKDITGNPRVKSILSKGLTNNRLPNSLLFIGPDGVGKCETALVVAKALNCLNKRDDACETCPACKGINAGNYTDVVLLNPAGDTYIKDQIGFLKQTCYLKPMVGKKRVFIVNEAERMNESSANSLLKVLEEPPLFAYIILISDNPFLLLSTIKSRCQILTFSPVSREDIEISLTERGYTPEKARILSLMAGGSLKLAMEMEWDVVKAFKARAWHFFISILNKEDAAAVLKEFVFRQKHDGAEDLKKILGILLFFCRDILLLKQEGNIDLLLNPDYLSDLKKAADMVPLQKLQLCLSEIDRTLYIMKKNVNYQLNLSAAYLHLSEYISTRAGINSDRIIYDNSV